MTRGRAGVAPGWVAFIALALGATSVAAQETPGTVGDTLKRPPELQRPPSTPIVQPRPTAPVRTASQKTVVVAAFRIVGNTIYSAEELYPLVREYIGRPVTLADIYDAADKIGEFYVKNGYSLASVSVPAQNITAGIVTLEVFEGRIGRIRVEGNERYRAERIDEYVGGIDAGEVYRSGTLESGMLQLNELPGLKARAVLQPGQQYGSSDLVVQVEEDPFEGMVFLDNHGRQNIGEFRLGANLTLNNPLTFEDRLNVLALVSEDALLKYGYVAYDFPMAFAGSRLALSYGEADFEVEGFFTGIEGTNRVGRATVTTPWRLERARRFSTSVGISHTDANVDLTGATFAETEITLLELGSLWSRTWDSFAFTQLALNAASNFNVPDEERQDQAFRLEMDLQHLQPISLSAGIELLARLNGVFSPDPLPDTSQFSLGGPNSVRGYPPSEVRGDRGYLASLSLQKDFPIGVVRMKGRLFADSGWVERIDPPPGAEEDDTLSAVGLGADTTFPGNVLLRLDAAYPLDDRPASDNRDDGRIFGVLSVGF